VKAFYLASDASVDKLEQSNVNVYLAEHAHETRKAVFNHYHIGYGFHDHFQVFESQDGHADWHRSKTNGTVSR
jgi:hypothetical protein